MREKVKKQITIIKEEIKGEKNKGRVLRRDVRTQFRVQIRNNPIIRRFKAEEREREREIRSKGEEEEY